MKTLKTLMLMMLLLTGTSVSSFAEGENTGPKDCMEDVNQDSINSQNLNTGTDGEDDKDAPADKVDSAD